MDTQQSIAATNKPAMHTVTVLREPAQNFAGGTRFTMMDGPTPVICWVSREVLGRLSRGSTCQQDPVVCFEQHRARIEQLARQRYDAGERSPIVMTFDLETVR
jgi:hypothetical protein